ncbi:unnamed protein product [Staurois parvus]|uniref:Uncharacterized protein n=1 Tax=Staurois parvus TaxID=386267 RepID=A0ABN9DDE5_9NEOB|nr:unnamed protein product [Staurois parvus]
MIPYCPGAPGVVSPPLSAPVHWTETCRNSPCRFVSHLYSV